MITLFGNSVRKLRSALREDEETLPEVAAQPLQTYHFNVCAVDGSTFTMAVLASSLDVASRCVKHYPGIVSFEPMPHSSPPL
jgi:hypothetical protein